MSIKVVASISQSAARHVIVLANRTGVPTESILENALEEYLAKYPVEGLMVKPLDELLVNEIKPMPRPPAHNSVSITDYQNGRHAWNIPQTDTNTAEEEDTAPERILPVKSFIAKKAPTQTGLKKKVTVSRASLVNSVTLPNKTKLNLVHRKIKGEYQPNHINTRVLINSLSMLTEDHIVRAATGQTPGHTFYIFDLFAPSLWHSFSKVEVRRANTMARNVFLLMPNMKEFPPNSDNRRTYAYLGDLRS